MKFFPKLILIIPLLCSTFALGAPPKNEPHIGYLYPAGGQRGQTILITVGGQFLRGASQVYVSGEGVSGSVIKYIKPVRNLDRDQREELQRRMKQRWNELIAKLPEKERFDLFPNARQTPKEPSKSSDSKKEETVKVELPDHPLWHNLENKSLRELIHINSFMTASRGKIQLNRQIAEFVLVELNIEKDAKPGSRELRIETPIGLTNPIVFQIGIIPETLELEPNNGQLLPRLRNLPKAKPLELPVVLNGQIMPGDVDRFRFRAAKDQKLVIETQARSLIPYLADAVPGWFQATLALYDENGNEVAFADDYRFKPDPVLLYNIPKNGEYELQIRDSIYRGREDFIYRVSVSEQPFITNTFPLGAKAGEKTVAVIDGWNLPEKQIKLDTQPSGDQIRHAEYSDEKHFSNSISYTVDTLPERTEVEPNNSRKDPQQIELPMIINGRIETAGDIDVFRLKGKAGEELVAEVYGRRLDSPLDSLIRLTDISDNVLAWNDDHIVKDSHLHKDTVGLITHHADSYLRTTLPKDGTYYIHLLDSQNHGGQAYTYRLRISNPQPDFALRITPSSLSMRSGTTIPFCVHVLRKDGFDGQIKVVLKDTSTGFRLDGGLIPAGIDQITMTLTAPNDAPDKPLELHFEGQAEINGQTITRPVVPSEDMMQAFLYRHLVPSQQLLVAVKQTKWRVPPVEFIGDEPVRISAGGKAQVKLKTPKRPVLKELQLELNDPPAGLSIHNVTVVPVGLAFELHVDKDALQEDFAGNIIIEAFREVEPKNNQDGKGTNKKRRVSMDFFPAIPVKIVK